VYSIEENVIPKKLAVPSVKNEAIYNDIETRSLFLSSFQARDLQVYDYETKYVLVDTRESGSYRHIENLRILSINSLCIV
jgi:hypothetical protein